MSSPVRRELEEYIAGRSAAERVVIAASVAYYRDTAGGMREALRPVVDVIDRASPGIIELGSVTGGAGFDVRLAERPFPKTYEDQLRQAAVAALEGLPPAVASPVRAGLVRRMLGAIQRLFSG